MSGVSARVTEENGEISASVEETNRVRAELGLAPLAEKGAKEAAEAARHAERLASVAKEEQEEELRERLSSAREGRLRKQKVGGLSLGEQLASEEMDSAAAWVLKSRTQDEARKVKRREGKAKKKPPGSAVDAQSRRYDEMDAEEQGESQVGGALVGHATDDFAAGESVILTLADQQLIHEEGNAYSLNQEDELLENVNMAEEQRRRKARDLARGTGGLAGDDSSLLHKYDDEADRTTVRLDARGGVDESKLKKLAAVKAKLAAAQGGGKAEYDLSTGQARAELATGTDYEPAEFKRPAAKAKKLRRKPVAEKLQLEPMEAESGSDHGSRAVRLAKLAEREAEAASRRAEREARFERALGMAEQQATQRLQPDAAVSEPADVDMAEAEADAGAAAAIAEAEAGAEAGAGAEAEAEESAEVDAELYAALSRARRVGRMTAERRNEDLAAQRLREQLEAAQRWRQEAIADPATGTDLGQLEFSETGEFCKAVRAKEEAEEAELPSQQYKQSKAQADRHAHDGVDANGNAVKKEARGGGDVKEEGESDRDDDDEEEEDDDELGEASEFLYEKAASSGMGAALQMARTRGMLGEEREASGRMFDQKGAGLHAYEEEDKETSFKLQYYDEFGRKMTQKQAFRQLSWKFHGKGPSKKRRERRMAEVEKQMAEQTKDRAMEYMGALQQAQHSTKSAHVVISGAQALKTSEVLKQQRAPPDKLKQQLKKKAKGSSGGGFDTSIPMSSGLSSAIPL